MTTSVFGRLHLSVRMLISTALKFGYPHVLESSNDVMDSRVLIDVETPWSEEIQYGNYKSDTNVVVFVRNWALKLLVLPMGSIVSVYSSERGETNKRQFRV